MEYGASIDEANQIATDMSTDGMVMDLIGTQIVPQTPFAFCPSVATWMVQYRASAKNGGTSTPFSSSPLDEQDRPPDDSSQASGCCDKNIDNMLADGGTSTPSSCSPRDEPSRLADGLAQALGCGDSQVGAWTGSEVGLPHNGRSRSSATWADAAEEIGDEVAMDSGASVTQCPMTPLAAVDSPALSDGRTLEACNSALPYAALGSSGQQPEMSVLIVKNLPCSMTPLEAFNFLVSLGAPFSTMKVFYMPKGKRWFPGRSWEGKAYTMVGGILR